MPVVPPDAPELDIARRSQEVYTSARSTGEVPPPPAGQPTPAPQRRTFGEGAQASIHTSIVNADPEIDRHTRIVDVSIPGVVRKAARQQNVPSARKPGRGQPVVEAESLSESIDQLGQSARMVYARMHRVDRIGLVFTFVSFVAAFLPWRHVLGEGLVSGIEGLGAASAGGALLIGVCIYIRTAKRRLAGLVLLLQLILAAGVVAVPVYLFFYQPGLDFHVGLYAAALSGSVVILLTFARMAVRA